MSVRSRISAALLAAILCGLAACNQNKPAQDSAAAPAAAPAAATPQPAVQLPLPPPPTPVSTELPVTSVDALTLNRSDDQSAIVLHVTGTVPSDGWTNARLVPDDAKQTADGVAGYKFVATSPAQPVRNPMPQSLEAEIRIAPVPAGMKTVRVAASGNAISAPVTQ